MCVLTRELFFGFTYLPSPCQFLSILNISNFYPLFWVYEINGNNQSNIPVVLFERNRLGWMYSTYMRIVRRVYRVCSGYCFMTPSQKQMTRNIPKTDVCSTAFKW